MFYFPMSFAGEPPRINYILKVTLRLHDATRICPDLLSSSFLLHLSIVILMFKHFSLSITNFAFPWPHFRQLGTEWIVCVFFFCFFIEDDSFPVFIFVSVGCQAYAKTKKTCTIKVPESHV